MSVPDPLGDLGVSSEDFARHIACDIGIKGMGMRLAALLDGVFIHQHYSRLVIDCNRDPAAPAAIPTISDGTAIPGNEALSAADRAARILEICRPYQERIGAEIAARTARGQRPLLISLHSFTPVMAGFARPWLYGVLHRGDSPFSRAVLAQLQMRFGEAAGDNEPYRMDQNDYTVPLHADGHRIDYLEIEVRQDLIADTAGQTQVAETLAEILPAALASRA